MEQQQGIIKNMEQDRKYGFIRGDSGIEFFFHKTGFVPNGDGIGFDNGFKGMVVTFDQEDSSRGPRAGNVRVKPRAAL